MADGMRCATVTLSAAISIRERKFITDHDGN